MHCSEVSEVMSLRLDTELPLDQERAFQEHLAMCESCAALWRIMQQASALFENAELAAPPPQFAAKVMTRLHRRNAWLVVARSLLMVVLGLVIAAVCCLAPLADTPLAPLLGAPSTLSTTLGALLALLGAVGTVVRALLLMGRALFFSPPWVVWVIYLSVVAGLTALWVRLVLQRTPSVGDHVS